MTPAQAALAMADQMGRFTRDPLGWVMFSFPWGVEGGPLASETGPDEWQRNELTHIADALEDDPWAIIRRAIASGHGIGKSTFFSWLILWAITTYPDTRGVVTANTDTQLRTKTWPELTKWFQMLDPVLRSQFTATATAVYSNAPGHERTWRIDAIPWSKTNPAAFAGLHNAGKRVMILFDEASEIDDIIWDTAEGATTDADTQIIWIVAGNPTRNSGRFREVVEGKFRGMWKRRQIDSRTCKRTNKTLLAGWVEAFGEDSDFVRVRVRGQFPRMGSLQFIPSDLVRIARTRVVAYEAHEPLVAGLDVARFGDDKSVLRPRMGRDARSIPKKTWRGVDTMTLAGDVALWCKEFKPAALFVDIGGLGVGVFDRLIQLRIPNVYGINFGSPGGDIEFNGMPNIKTANLRAKMWGTMRGWLEYGCVEDSNDLETDLTGVEYGFRGTDNAILLEAKEHMKARGLDSPDDGDALALTFAMPVASVGAGGVRLQTGVAQDSYDFFAGNFS
jgi:hypothetical protein